MTIEAFQRQLLEINAQWINIRSQAANLAISGNNAEQTAYLESMQSSIELLHACLDSLSNSLTREDKVDFPAALLIQAGKMKKDIFALCGSNYRKVHIAQKEERKNSKLESLKDSPLNT